MNPNLSTGTTPDGQGQELGAEIARLRRLIRQTATAVEQAAAQEEAPSLEDLVRVLNAVSSASTRLAALIKTQQALKPAESDQLAAALKQALERFHSE